MDVDGTGNADHSSDYWGTLYLKLSNASAASATPWVRAVNDVSGSMSSTCARLRGEHLGSTIRSIISVRTLALKSQDHNTSGVSLLFRSRTVAVSRV
jgi:hypothetical protein